MAYGLETAIDKLTDIFFNTTFAETTWLMYIVIIVASLLLVTRKTNEWGSLALPIMIGWKYFGMPIPNTFMIAGAIMFVLTTISVNIVVKTIGIPAEIAQRGMSYITRRGRLENLKRNVDIKEQMSKIEREYNPQRKRIISEFNEWEQMKKDSAINKKLENEKYGNKKDSFGIDPTGKYRMIAEDNLLKIARGKNEEERQITKDTTRGRKKWRWNYEQ